MSRLLFAIAYTHDLRQSAAFYRDHVGLSPGSQSPFWVDFGTRGAAFALLAVDGSTRREVGLCFGVDDIDAHVARLRARGVALAGEVRNEPFGRVVALRDPDGNALSFLQPARPTTRGGNDVALFVSLHSDEPGALASFYRDRLGFEVASESPAAMEFETGATRLRIDARPTGEDLPAHATQRLAVGFEYEALDPAADAMRGRGLRFSAAPAAEEEGVFAEALDPDGHLIVFREPAPEPTMEEQLAEAFVDDDTPHQVAIRKPVRKSSKATSFVAVKPSYGATKKARKKKAEAKVLTRALTRRVKEKAAVASPRGTGPAGTRAKPKRTADARRAKVKPATGRLKKAARKVAQRKKRATARASKSKPVKRAVTKRAAPKRGRRR